MNAHRTRLGVDLLEERTVPAAYNPWPDAGHITISFAPDGTPINGAASSLYHELGTNTTAWQTEILRAFQTWGALVNVDVSLTPDDGAAFGAAGPLQGDSRRGDIRIGARPLGTEVAAITNPFDLFGNWAGDVVLNTDQAFNLGGTGGAYDLFTVALHEAGHSFGLEDGTDTTSAMYADYIGPRTAPSAADVANIRSLYGARTPDRFDAAQPNNTQSSATPVSLLSSVNLLQGQDLTTGVSPYVIAGDLTTASDVDYYRVSTLSLLSVTVSLRTSGISLLKAKVTLYNSSGKAIGSATATDPRTGDLTFTAGTLLPLGTFYVKVEKAADDAFATGSYRLAVGSVSAALALGNPVTAGLLTEDKHTNDTAAQATDLTGSASAYSSDLRWNYTVRANLLDSTDADWYKVKAPAVGADDMLVAVWGTASGGVDPLVTVLDANKKPVAASVLTNDGGAVTLQILNPVAGGTYYVDVTSDKATGNRTGAYFFGTTFKLAPVQMTAAASATLTQSAPQIAQTLTVYETDLFHFALSATSANPLVNSAVRMTILDASGKQVFSLFVAAGQSTSGDVLLAAGSYTIVYTAGTPDGSTLPDLTFALDYLIRTDPIGMTPKNTSTSSSGSTSPPPSTTTTTTYQGPYTSPYSTS
jgi:hypothetical protein